MKTQRPRTPKDDQILLGAMLRSEDRGDCRTLKLFLEQRGHHLKVSADHEVKVDYEKLLSRAEEAFEYERLHGEGSLFKLDHPANQRFIDSLPPHYPEAIEREKARKSTNNRDEHCLGGSIVQS